MKSFERIYGNESTSNKSIEILLKRETPSDSNSSRRFERDSRKRSGPISSDRVNNVIERHRLLGRSSSGRSREEDTR